jgi:HK97 family phage portal protein
MLWNIVPNAIDPVALNSYGEIKEFRYTQNSQNVPKSEIVYIKSFNALQSEAGFSSVKASGILIDTYNSFMRWNYSLSQNGGIPPMVIKPKTGALTAERRAQIETQLARKVNGWNNAGKPLIQEGDAEYQILGIKPVEAQWLESMQELWRQICVAMGSSPELWGSEKGTTFNNRAEAMKDLYLNTILPKAQIFLDAINTQLLPDFANSQGLRFIVDKGQIDALNESQDALWNRVRGVFNDGLISTGEAREEIGFDENVPHADTFFMPSNKVPITE